jgi:hypothetical protein
MYHFLLQALYVKTGSELESMIGDTNLFLSEGGKHAEVASLNQCLADPDVFLT